MNLIIPHEILSIILFYTCFCRAIKTNGTVKKDVLAAFWLLGIVSSIAIFAPLSFGWEPDCMSLVLLFAVVVVQIVTSEHWRHGIPKEFIHEDQRELPLDHS